MLRTMEHLLENEHFPHGKIAFMVGPRQVGKTTLARAMLVKRGSADLYRNWDDLEWRKEFTRSPYGFVDGYRPSKGALKPLVVLDEIHKHPKWKGFVKGFWDTRGDKVDLLVTGSGRLDVYQRGGDSLLGRYRQYRLHPLSVREITAPAGTSSNDTPEKTVARISTVQQLATQTSTDGSSPQVLDTNLSPGGWPADRVDVINRKFHTAMPVPQLPSESKSGSGGTAGTSTGK